MEGESGEEKERGRAVVTETREQRECENASSHWWVEGVRTQQLTNIRASQTSAALHLFCHSNTHAHLHTHVQHRSTWSYCRGCNMSLA